MTTCYDRHLFMVVFHVFIVLSVVLLSSDDQPDFNHITLTRLDTVLLLSVYLPLTSGITAEAWYPSLLCPGPFLMANVPACSDCSMLNNSSGVSMTCCHSPCAEPASPCLRFYHSYFRPAHSRLPLWPGQSSTSWCAQANLSL